MIKTCYYGYIFVKRSKHIYTLRKIKKLLFYRACCIEFGAWMCVIGEGLLSKHWKIPKEGDKKVFCLNAGQYQKRDDEVKNEVGVVLKSGGWAMRVFLES